MMENTGHKLILTGLCIALLSNTSILNAAWVNATSNLAGLPSECEQIAAIWAIPNVNKIFTVVSGVGSYETTNGGSSWTKTSSVVNFRFMQMLIDPVNPNVWWACGIYHTPGVVKTTDAGATWVGLGNVNHNDGFSVDFSDPQRKLILAGAHEASRTLWKTTNEGQTWTNIGGNLPSGTSCWPYIINSQTYLMGLQRVGIYKTTDGGGSWNKVCNGADGFITKTKAGDLYCAVGTTVYRGTPNGETWTATSMQIANALPTWVVELPGGKIASINNNGIYISADKGVTSKLGCRPLPAAVTSNYSGTEGLCYNDVEHAFYTFFWTCENTVKSNQIWRFDTLIEGGNVKVQPGPCSISSAAFLSSSTQNETVFDIAGKRVDIGIDNISHLSNAPKLYLVKMADRTALKRIAADR